MQGFWNASGRGKRNRFNHERSPPRHPPLQSAGAVPPFSPENGGKFELLHQSLGERYSSSDSERPLSPSFQRCLPLSKALPLIIIKQTGKWDKEVLCGIKEPELFLQIYSLTVGASLSPQRGMSGPIVSCINDWQKRYRNLLDPLPPAGD